MTDFAVPKAPLVRKVPSRVPDYNPDREGHVEHTFVVQKADRSPGDTISVGNTEIKLNAEGRAFIKDEVLAREIQTENRFNTTVTRMRTPSVADAGPKYHFGQMPEMPWKRKASDGAGEEIKGEPQDQEAGQGGGLSPGTGDSNSPDRAGQAEEAA